MLFTEHRNVHSLQIDLNSKYQLSFSGLLTATGVGPDKTNRSTLSLHMPWIINTVRVHVCVLHASQTSSRLITGSDYFLHMYFS